MKLKKGVWIIWNNGINVMMESCSLTSYRYHIRNKDSRIVYLYSCKCNYPRKIIGLPDEYFSNKLI